MDGGGQERGKTLSVKQIVKIVTVMFWGCILVSSVGDLVAIPIALFFNTTMIPNTQQIP